MGRKKIEIKPIDNKVNMQVTFSKRRRGFLKKADELAVLCKADVGVIIFASNNKVFDYCNTEIETLINKYLEHKGKKTKERGSDHQGLENPSQDQAIITENKTLKKQVKKMEKEKQELLSKIYEMKLECYDLYHKVYNFGDIKSEPSSSKMAAPVSLTGPNLPLTLKK